MTNSDYDSRERSKEKRKKSKKKGVTIDNSLEREQAPQFKYQQYQRLILLKRKQHKRGYIKDIVFGEVEVFDAEAEAKRLEKF